MILDTSKYIGECSCGRVHQLRTKLVVCEYGALNSFDSYMEECGLTGFRTVIYDTNTYNLPSMVHVKADQEIVLEAQGLHSEKGLIEDMMKKLQRKPDFIVAVGAGTLMDFGRYSAYQLGIPFVAVPTLVSSDGFTANICSIVIDGHKKSIPMIAPSAVICDMNIIEGAPHFLTVSGMQDILSKHISIADWKIAHLVSGEYFCPMVCSMAQEALDTMVVCAREMREGKPVDFEAMAYAQMLSGLTMPVNKRNWRKQEEHLGRARAVQAFDDPNGNWRNKKGRPSAQVRVYEWRQRHPEGRKADCHRETGLDPKTVRKWWDCPPPAVRFENGYITVRVSPSQELSDWLLDTLHDGGQE